jgi:hypothetical protein
MSTEEVVAADQYKIVVDTIEQTIHDPEVTWKHVVDLAYPGQADDPQLVFKVHFEDAKGDPSSGTLVKGNHVTVKKSGTTFSVLRSVVS